MTKPEFPQEIRDWLRTGFETKFGTSTFITNSLFTFLGVASGSPVAESLRSQLERLMYVLKTEAQNQKVDPELWVSHGEQIVLQWLMEPLSTHLQNGTELLQQEKERAEQIDRHALGLRI